jgi:hypothetical protein
VLAAPAGDDSDSDRAVVRLKGEDAGRVGALRVVVSTSDGSDLRLSRRLAKRGFTLQRSPDGNGAVIAPPQEVPVPPIGKGAVLRMRHGGRGARLGAVELGSTGGHPLKPAGAAGVAGEEQGK